MQKEMQPKSLPEHKVSPPLDIAVGEPEVPFELAPSGKREGGGQMGFFVDYSVVFPGSQRVEVELPSNQNCREGVVVSGEIVFAEEPVPQRVHYGLGGVTQERRCYCMAKTPKQQDRRRRFRERRRKERRERRKQKRKEKNKGKNAGRNRK